MSDQLDQLLASADYIASPNYNQRPDLNDISLLVIHGISLPPGQFGGNAVIDLFCNRLDCTTDPNFAELVGLQVSAHLFIRRDGKLIQFVPLEQRAWHAGQSQFQGRSHCNDFSIGIELEGTDEIPYTDAQYRQLALMIVAIQQRYPAITADRIVGHYEIAPGRKTDPGPVFDWPLLRRLLGAVYN